ncbi:MAG: D-aminoacylase [Bacteroidetes bacterium]|nr:MAG: D-aminoacylase [Bacteroidota bacterium]
MKSFFVTLWLGVVLLLACRPHTSVDILIENGTVLLGQRLDSSGLDVGISGDRITFVGEASKAGITAKQTIQAEGLVVCPGFIDPHTHALPDLTDSANRANLPFMMQGVTTVVVGNDGRSPEVGPMLAYWDSAGTGTNVAMFVGHGSVRARAMGLENRPPDSTELLRMQQEVAAAMEAGALGLSTGLFYAPGSYASTAEVVALAKIAASYGGIYDTHLRDESSYTVGLMAAVEEALQIGREAPIPVHISHIKALGADVWGKCPEVVQMVEAARAEGLEVTANQYPYTASKTSLIAALVPRWAEAGGRDSLRARLRQPALRQRILAGIAENIRRRGGPQSLVITQALDSSLNFRSLAHIAAARQLPPAQAVVTLIEAGEAPGVISHNMQEQDLSCFMQQAWVVTGSDGGASHPRKYGSFPRKIRHYALEKGVISLEQALYSSSTLTASILGLHERGKIETGFFADICIFDPHNFRDLATFEQPTQYAQGVVYLFINGRPAISQATYQGTLPGRALRKTPAHGKKTP